MKTIFRNYIVETLSLYLSSQLVSGVIFSAGIHTLLLAGLALTLATFVIKPVLNILLLPLNLITFGLFKWVSSLVALYITTLLVPGFTIAGFYFAAITNVPLPAINLSGTIGFVAFSFFLSFITSIIHWAIK